MRSPASTPTALPLHPPTSPRRALALAPWLVLGAALIAGCDDGAEVAIADARADRGAGDQGTADQGAPDRGGEDQGAADRGPADAGTDDQGLLDPDLGPPAEPGALGPWPVGFATERIDYPDPNDPEATRSLALHYWYPAQDGTASGPARYGDVFPRAEVQFEAALAPLTPRPVVVFSHGNGGLAEQSYFFTEFLASHGYVVVAPDHTGNTALGARLPMYQFFDLRPLDIIAVLDHLDALGTEPALAAHRFAGRLGAARGLAGHSFGGYTTLALGGPTFSTDAIVAAACSDPVVPPSPECAYLQAGAADRFRAGYGDDRLLALIPMTPAGNGLFGPGLDQVSTPVLLMTGGRDATLPDPVEGDPIWAGLPAGPHLRLDFPNAGHYTFSDACTLLPGVGANDGCAPDFTPTAEAHRLINAYALAFLRLHLDGDPSGAALLDGPSLDAAVLQIERKPAR